MPLSRLLLWIALCGAAFACASRIPSYGRPQGGLADPSTLDSSDVIRYRTLTREDFHATEPPPKLGSYAQRIGARTCAQILAAPDAKLWWQEIRHEGGASTFRGSIRNLGFLARMDRRCSWWNANAAGLPEAYVLQHEQIHFAIVELEARRLNREAPDIMADVQVEGDSREEVQAKLQKELESILSDALERMNARDLDFDEDTSGTYAPKVQKEWFEKVTEELKETATP